MAAIMTYEDGLSILKSTLSKTRGYLQEPTLFLYIVHAYYEGWLERDNKWPLIEWPEDYCTPLENLVTFIDSEKSNDVAFLRPGFDAIYKAYMTIPGAFTELYYSLRLIPIVWFEQPWPEDPKEQYWTIAFDDLLSLIDKSSGKSSAEYSQPKLLGALIRTVMAFCNVHGELEDTVYDPFGGIGRFLNPGEPSYYQDIREDVCALARLRSLAQTYMPAATRDYVCADSTKEWAKNSEGLKSFDCIVSFPPMGIKVPVTPEMGIKWPAQKISLEDYYICKGSQSLNEGGKLIGVFSNSILYVGGATGAQREKLIRDGRVIMVVQLPANILTGTGVSTCIVVISDKTTQADHILFLDASTSFSEEKRRNVLTIDETTKNILEAHGVDAALARYFANVPVQEVIANDCILIPARYIKTAPNSALDVPEGFEAIPLGDLVTVSRGNAASLSKIRQIRGRDLLSEGPIDYLSFEDLPLEPAPERSSILNEDSVLVLRVGRLKPTLFRPKSGVNVALNPNVTALVPKDEIDPYYLVSELRKPYVSEQVDALSQGAIIPHLRMKDLLGILVLLPIERSSQHQLFLNSQRVTQEQKLREQEIEETIKNERNRLSEMMSIRRHRINPYISGLRSNVSMILDELYAKGSLSPETELSSDYTVQDALENMEQSLTELKSLFDTLTADNSIGIEESIKLIPFLKKYVYTSKVPDCHFELDKSHLSLAQAIPPIAFNPANLTELLDEIIYNAEKHFAPNAPGYRVMFVPRYDGKQVSLLICNNGEPVPDDFDEERSFVAGYHKDEHGTGQGLFRIRQLCDEFGAKVVWENDPDNLMPTGLCITFKRSID